MPSKIITNELKEEIINYYLSKPMSYQDIANKYNLSLPTIGKILINIPKYAKAQIYNPNLIEDFFEIIDSEEKAYFLGLLITDGNVFCDTTNNRQASISITLDLKDVYILKRFKQAVQTNTSIALDGRGCGQIAVRSNKMANDLAKYGVVPRKSFSTFLPNNIDDNLMPHLIRGILDGDGHIEARQSPTTTKYLHRISICGNHQLLENINDYIYNNLHTEIKQKVYDYKDRKLSDLTLGASINDMYIVGEWLYKNATIYMTRKKDNYNNFKQHYHLI